MRIAFFDAFAGASGDMLLGALIDAGASESGLSSVITALHLEGCSAKFERVMKGALSALQVTILTPEKETERHASELIAIVEKSELSDYVKRHAIAIIERLAEVEARAHDSTPDHVHLHELGGDDTLIDICGVLHALEELQTEHVYVSALPLATGMTQSMHGLIPLPAPATLALLKGALVRSIKDVQVELLTPTGAALLTSLAEGYGEFPTMQLSTVGVGAGRRNLAFPNITRVLIGEAKSPIHSSIAHLTSIDHHAHDHSHSH